MTDAVPSLDALHADLVRRWPESRIAPSLDRIARLMELLGDPQRACPVIHVTGTNGKTTTARIIESLLRAHGLRTGLYTSPHLHSVTERIRIDGQPIADETFVEGYADIAPYVEIVDAESVTQGGPAMSYFEVITGLALALFADAPVDVAVVEVGMGGAWDATNVCDGAVAVVTPIGLDHAEYLGPTIESVAGEKAGIIKPGSIAVLAAQPPEAAEVLLARCAEADVVPWREGLEYAVADRELAVGGQVVTVQVAPPGEDVDVLPGLVLPLHGAHQAQNAAAAIAATAALLGPRGLDAETVGRGLEGVTSPGRLEVVRRSPTVIVDAAHNPHGVAALVSAIEQEFSFDHLVGVVSVLSDKDARSMLEQLATVLAEVVVTRNSSPRAVDAEELRDLAVEAFGEERVLLASTLPGAVDLAMELADRAGGSGTGVLVTGSVVTAADARLLLRRAD